MTPRISRRQFIAASVFTGIALGCGPATGVTAPPLADTSSTPAPAPGVLPAGMRFALEHDSIGYGPHPRGCDVTSIRGAVRLADGSPLAGMVVRIWADDPAQATDVLTNAEGFYGADVAQGTPKATYHLLLLDSTKNNRLSDVIIANATGSCDLNMLTVNFVPTAGSQ